MKHTITLLLAFVMIAGCSNPTDVTQELRYNCNLCGNEDNVCYATYAWVDGNIAADWYDNPYTITDSLKQERIKQANTIITKLKKLSK